MSWFGHTKDVGNVLIQWANAGVTMSWETWGGGAMANYAYPTGTGAPIVPNHLTPGISLVCLDLPLLALVENNWENQAGIHAIYADIINNGANGLRATGIGASMNSYTLNGGSGPPLGHLVFFNGIGHVAVATGQQATHLGTTGTEIVSFWTDVLGNPPAGGGPVANTPVMFDTIERLAASQPVGILTPVTTAKPAWR